VATYGSGPVPDALILAPAGALVSTAADMGRFMRASLRNSSMLAPQWRADSSVPGVATGFFMSDLAGVPGLFHTGARTHFSLLYLVPEHELGVFIVHAMRQGGPHQNLRTNFVRAVVERLTGSRDDLPSAPGADGPPVQSYAAVYRPSLLATTNIEKAARLFMDAPIEMEKDGSLTASIPGGARLHLIRVGRDHFRVATGPQRGLHFFFQRNARGNIAGFAMSGVTQDPVSFDRLSLLQRGSVHAVVLAVIGALLAVPALGAPITWLRRQRRRQHVTPQQRLAWRALAATGWGILAAPLSAILLVLSHQGEDTAAAGLRFALRTGLTVLLVAALVSVALPPCAVLAWRKRWWGTPRRVYYTMAAVGVVFALPLLWHYHLLGYWQ
jgi:hypothetical protein